MQSLVLNGTLAPIYLLCTGIDQWLSNGWRDVESLVQMEQKGASAYGGKGCTVSVKQQPNVTLQKKLWKIYHGLAEHLNLICVCALVTDVFKALCLALFIHQP